MTDKIKNKYVKLQEDFQKKINTGKLGKLSMSDLYSIGKVGQELLKRHTGITCMKNVAEYFEAFGFLVTMDFNKVNYIIVEA